MKVVKLGLVGAGLACFLILLPNKASAHICRWPHRCERDYYRWLDRGRYVWLDKCQYNWNYCRPLTVKPKVQCQPFWFGPYPRVVIKQRPVVIKRRVVIVEPRKYDGEKCELLKRIRGKKNEWFKEIKEGNKEERREAIENLAGFSSDALVRAVLEKVLFSEPEPEVRKEAAKSLGKVNNWKALPALKRAKAEDSDEEVRKEAEKAIKKVKERFLKKLKETERLFGKAKREIAPERGR